MEKKEFKISLAAASVNARLIQDEFAKRMHVSKTTILNWEKGRNNPPFASLQCLATLYEMPIDYIFLSK